jgi:hypothetical protein
MGPLLRSGTERVAKVDDLNWAMAAATEGTSLQFASLAQLAGEGGGTSVQRGTLVRSPEVTKDETALYHGDGLPLEGASQ